LRIFIVDTPSDALAPEGVIFEKFSKINPIGNVYSQVNSKLTFENVNHCHAFNRLVRNSQKSSSYAIMYSQMNSELTFENTCHSQKSARSFCK